MVRLGMTDDVDDLRLERHLQVDAGGQVAAGRMRVEGVTEQAGAGLLPDAEIRLLNRGARSVPAPPAFWPGPSHPTGRAGC